MKINLKEWFRQIDARQQKADFSFPKTEAMHVCEHCQTAYVGNFCPQCGQSYNASRFTLRTLVMKVLDILGFDESGRHSAVRTLRDLLWRPGYMIRDYLGGHSVAYFQPFKLLIFLSIVFTLLLYLMGVERESSPFSVAVEKLVGDKDMADFTMFLTLIKMVIDWFHENSVYSVIFQNIFIVTAMWKVYRHRATYTWVETFVAQMYICCQFAVLGIVQMLLTWNYNEPGLYPYPVYDYIMFPVLLLDYHQLYGEHRLWPAIWRYLKIAIWLFLQYLALILLIVVGMIIYGAIIKD